MYQRCLGVNDWGGGGAFKFVDQRCLGVNDWGGGGGGG